MGTYEAMLHWCLERRDVFDDPVARLSSASKAELEFLTYGVAEVRPTPSALPVLDLAVEKDPGSFWLRARQLFVRVKSGRELEHEKQVLHFRTAVTHGEAALALWPGSTVVRLNLSLAYGELDDYGNAERVLRALNELDPSYADAWVNLGGVLVKQERWAEGLAALRKGVELQPRDVSNWMALGLAADSCLTSVEGSDPLFQRAVDTSVEAWRKVHELDPKEWQAYLYLGAAYMAVGRFDEAIAEYDAGMPLHPHDRDLRNFKAEALFDATRVRAALELELEVLKDWPKDPSARDNFERWLPSITDPAERAALEARLPPR